jgi:cytochrome bd-type quinol oxidase subunit 2
MLAVTNETPFDDGLWDVFLGLLLLMLGLNTLTMRHFDSLFGPLLVALGINLLAFVSQWGGRVLALRSRRQLPHRQHSSVKWPLISAFSFAGVAIMAVVINFPNNWNRTDPILTALYMILVIGILWAGAYRLKIARFYGYGILCALTVPAGIALEKGLRDPAAPFFLAFMIPAVIIIIAGMTRFIRFMRSKPDKNQ